MIYFFGTIFFIAVILFAIGIDAYRKWRNLNIIDRSPLRINTFDGRWSPYHPSVLFFENGWNGWKYWMAETPYSLRTKPYGDRNECPSIHVSNDGINWKELEGLSNPLEDLTPQQVKDLDYFSDPCLVCGPGGRLECWYRLTERRGEKELRTIVSLRRRYSSNGIDWSPVEIMAQLNENTPGKGLGNVVVSPAILYDEDKGYSMWFVNMETAGCPDFQGVSFSTSIDGKSWSDAQEVKFNRPIHQWHIDVQRIDNQYMMTIFNFEDISIWESLDGLNYNYITTSAVPTSRPFSIHEGLYKSCLIKDTDEFKLYIGSHDSVDTFISLMHGASIGSLRHYNTVNATFINFLSRYFYYQQRRVKFIFKHIFCKNFS